MSEAPPKPDGYDSWDKDRQGRYDRLVFWARQSELGDRCADAIEGKGPQVRLFGLPVKVTNFLPKDTKPPLG